MYSNSQQVCLATLSNVTATQFSDLLRTVTPQDLNRFCTFKRKGVDVTCTALYSACREGNLQMVMSLVSIPGVNVDGIQDKISNETPLRAAQGGGWVEIVALLLISGAEPTTEKRIISEKMNLKTLWAIYDKQGVLGLVIDYPDFGGFLAKSKIYPQAEQFFAKIDEFIFEHPNLPNLMWTKRITSTGNPANSLVIALETLLISLNYAVGKEHNFLEKAFQEHLKESITDTLDQTKPSLLSLFPQMYNINVVVILYNTVYNTVVRKKYYVNPYKRKDYPFVYIAFNGIRYDALVPKSPIDSDITQSPEQVTIDQLFEAIDNRDLHPEDFDHLLKNFNLSNVNNLHKYMMPMPVNKIIECTLFYYACRSGRDDLIGVLLQLENIQINKTQETFGGNTPLHVANWRGHVNIVVFLLYSGADGKALNKSRELPSVINKESPDHIKERLKNIWTIYQTMGPENCKEKLKDFRVEEESTKFTRTSSSAALLTNSKVNTTPSGSSAQLLSTVTTVEGLCSILSSVNPPTPEQFREKIKNFEKSQINNFSAYADYKCTPLYCAARAGHVELIKEMIEYFRDNLKLGGVQETKTGHGNTPLHVANWNGHIPVVALLLCYVSPEKKTGGSLQMPGDYKERNFLLPEETRNVLVTLLQKPPQRDYLMTFTTKESLTNIIPARDIPLPLDTYLSIPKEEIPPQYLRQPYLWYQKVGNTMTLLPLHITTHLNTEYSKFRRMTLKFSGDQTVKFTCPIPPEPQILSVFGTSPGNWTYEPWVVNFKFMTAEVDRVNTKCLLQLSGRARSKIYYWKTTEQGPWQAFSNKINNTLSQARYQNHDAVNFSFSLEKSLFAKPYTCQIKFLEKVVTMTKDGKSTTHKIMDEETYAMTASWEPDQYLRSYFNAKDDTLMELKPESEEYRKVSNAFFLTMSEKKNEIVSINRYMSPRMSKEYAHALQKAKEVHPENIRDSLSYSKLLWHGSGGLPPNVLLKEGWKINYSSNKNLWGPGTYFASDAAYSAGYSYQDKKTGHRTMFLAQVIVGQGLQCLENNRIIDKPAGYNSVIGWRIGSWVYILYESHQAFPTYTVEWKEKK